MQAYNNQKLQKFIVPAFYLIAMALALYHAWNEYSVRHKSNSPLYRNLMDYPAYIRRGFNPEELLSFANGEPGSAAQMLTANTGTWFGFKPGLRIVKNSLLPDLPKRKFLSPFGLPAEEFTIIIPVEIDEKAMSLLEESQKPWARPVLPGMFLAYIGENWGVYFNGTPVRSEIHLDEKGRITKERTLRSVSFPIERSLVKLGTNIIALRVIGDPGSVNTGLYYNKPHYIDEYRIIQRQQNKFIITIICGIFGFTGIYYLTLFFFFNNKREIFYLFFGIFSALVCINITMRHGLIVSLTNSAVLFRMEFASIMLTMAFFYMFIESLGRGKVTKPTWGFLMFTLYFTITQIFFCNQYGIEAVYLWMIVSHTFFIYVIVYDIVYLYFLDKKRNTIINIKLNNEVPNSVIMNTIVGTLTIFFAGTYEILDTLSFKNSYSFFPYSTFIVLIGMSFAMQERFSKMYNMLERTNIMLESDFARNIISSGQKHYQKMNGIYETLRILRHDYKYHLRAIGELVKSGELERIKQYLADLRALTPENELMIFCSNPVLNALLGYYAERCAKLDIKYSFQLALPETFSISNHEMCIILGNLLENAVEACQKIALSSEQSRKIELVIKTQGLFIAVMVKNSFCGVVVKRNGHPVSTKEDGGFGLQSVRTVTTRYDGYVHPKWDTDTFTVYVMLKM